MFLLQISPKTDIYEKITEHVKDMDIGILVNNVGMSSEYPDFFLSDQMSTKFCQDLINCNDVSLVMMTRIIAPGMVNRKKGVIMNISSLSALTSLPLMALYAASKSFVDHFSKTITHELSGSGIIVQTVLPGYVATKMSKIRKTSSFVLSADSFVDAALDMFGVQSRTFACLPHSLTAFAMTLIPACIGDRATFFIMSGTRKKALARQKKN